MSDSDCVEAELESLIEENKRLRADQKEMATRFHQVSSLLTNLINKDWKWTKDRPQVPGFYWWRTIGGKGYIYYVYESSIVFDLCISGFGKVSQLGGEWCGPLPKPGEAE